MGKIDCLFIGYNKLSSGVYNKFVKMAENDSYSARNLNYNFVRHNNLLYSASELFNTIVQDSDTASPMKVSAGNVFSLTIAYLGSFLEKKGFSFDYVNSFNEDKKELREILSNNEILSVAIPTTFYTNAYPISEIIQFVRKYNADAKIILGGPYILNQSKLLSKENLNDFFKNLNADFYIVSRQGECTLTNIIDSIKSNKMDFNNVNNIYYKENDNYVCTPKLEEDNKIEDNRIDWSLFTEKMGRLTSTRTAISCPFSCGFCLYPGSAGKYQSMSLEAIESEFDNIESTGKIKSIIVIDDTFNIPPEKFKQILRLMIRKKYSFKWTSFIRGQFLDREAVKLMKESGCQSVFLGLESANNHVLECMNKKATVEAYKNALGLLNEYGIISVGSFIIGYPGETCETAQETIRFIEEYKPTFFNLHLWCYVHNTPVYNNREMFNLSGNGYNWEHSTMDSSTAIKIVEEARMSIKNSISLPDYDYDIAGVIDMLSQGISLDKVKSFVNVFNLAVRDRMLNGDKVNLSEDLYRKIKEIFCL